MAKALFNQKSRSSNMILNAIFGIISYLLIIIVSFILRKFFADILGEEYLGLNNLFATIISMLSLTELGLGTAMVFYLYKPIALNDHQRINSYMHFYKQAYRVIAIAILLIGAVMVFILPSIIENCSLDMRKVQLFFVLYVLNSSVSYLFSYKKSILYADQKLRVSSVIHMILRLTTYISQIIVLLVYKSFLGYIFVMLVTTVLENLICVLYVNKHYSFTKDKNFTRLNRVEKKEVFIKVLPLMIQNLSLFLVDSIDTMIISDYIGIGMVGKYGNYTLIITTLTTLYYQIFSAFSAGFGNLSSTQEVEYCEKIYKRISYLSFFITAIFAFCYISMVQLFIGLLFGDHYVLPISIPICLTISFVINAITTPSSAAQNSLGLHKYDLGYLIVQGILNLILSLILVRYLGLVGVVVGTIIAKSLTTLYSKEKVLYKHFFKMNLGRALYRKSIYLCIIALYCTFGYWFFNIVWTDISVLYFIAKAITCVCMVGFLLVISTFWTDSFRYYVGIGKSLFKRLVK